MEDREFFSMIPRKIVYCEVFAQGLSLLPALLPFDTEVINDPSGFFIKAYRSLFFGRGRRMAKAIASASLGRPFPKDLAAHVNFFQSFDWVFDYLFEALPFKVWLLRLSPLQHAMLRLDYLKWRYSTAIFQTLPVRALFEAWDGPNTVFAISPPEDVVNFAKVLSLVPALRGDVFLVLPPALSDLPDEGIFQKLGVWRGRVIFSRR